ncbi:MAG: Rieske 2Fe-2S domain-containing protein [Pseudomonadota bacterium]
MGERIAVCQLSELEERVASVKEVGGERVALCRVAEQVYGFEGRCSHALKSLEGARVRGATLMCPHHGARFDLQTGKHCTAPAVKGIKTYQTEVEGGTVYVIPASHDTEDDN